MILYSTVLLSEKKFGLPKLKDYFQIFNYLRTIVYMFGRQNGNNFQLWFCLNSGKSHFRIKIDQKQTEIAKKESIVKK